MKPARQSPLQALFVQELAFAKGEKIRAEIRNAGLMRTIYIQLYLKPEKES